MRLWSVPFVALNDNALKDLSATSTFCCCLVRMTAQFATVQQIDIRLEQLFLTPSQLYTIYGYTTTDLHTSRATYIALVHLTC